MFYLFLCSLVFFPFFSICFIFLASFCGVSTHLLDKGWQRQEWKGSTLFLRPLPRKRNSSVGLGGRCLFSFPFRACVHGYREWIGVPHERHRTVQSGVLSRGPGTQTLGRARWFAFWHVKISCIFSNIFYTVNFDEPGSEGAIYFKLLKKNHGKGQISYLLASSVIANHRPRTHNPHSSSKIRPFAEGLAVRAGLENRRYNSIPSGTISFDFLLRTGPEEPHQTSGQGSLAS